MNLFIELHEARYGTDKRRFGTGWENLFTEQLAFFLSADLDAATSVGRALLGEQEIRTTGVTTQPQATEGIPDLRLDFDQDFSVHIELKFSAPLGPRQLQRYLRDGRVALISHCGQRIPPEVLHDAAYLRPSDRHYFDWRDVYDALPRASAAPDGFGSLREHFRGYMRELGLAPSALKSEWKRLFDERTAPDNQRVQKEFGRLLEPVKDALANRGFKVQNVSHKGKQAYAPPSASWLHLYVRPDRVRADRMDATDAAAFDPGYEALLVELVVDQSQLDFARRIYNAARARFKSSDGRSWYAVKPRRINRNRVRISLATPLEPMLNNTSLLDDTLARSSLDCVDHLLSLADQADRSSA